TSNIQELSTESTVLSARMDEFTKLKEGSTTGDAELIDGRIGSDGKTYDNIGGAIRGQVTDLKSDLDTLATHSSKGEIPLFRLIWETGAINSSTGADDNAYEKQKTRIRTGFIQYKTGEFINLNRTEHNVQVYVFYYNSNREFVSATSALYQTKIVIDTCAFFRIVAFNRDNQSWGNEITLDFGKYVSEAVLNEKINEIDSNISWLNNNFNVGTCFNVANPPIVTWDSTNDSLALKMPKDTQMLFNGVKYNLNNRECNVASVGGNIVYWICYDITLDTIMLVPNVQIESKSGNKSLVIVGYLHKRYNKAVLYGDELFSKNEYSKTVAPLILGANGLVEFDTKSRTITFPTDTLVLCTDITKGTRRAYYAQINAPKNIVSWNDVGSSAIRVYFNKSTSDITAVRYDFGQPEDISGLPYVDFTQDKYELLCAFRTNNGQVSISAPYIYDGMPFGTDISIYNPFEIETIKVINHRGYNTIAPENTIEAYKLSKKKGYNYVETDVSFTSDGVAVLLHDDTINRTARNADGSEIAEPINIKDITYQQALAYDFGIWKSDVYTGIKIPTFEEFIVTCKKLALHPYIEIKASTTYTEEQIRSLVDIVKRNGMINNVTWISYGHTYLTYIKNYYPKSRLGLVTEDISDSIISNCKNLMNGVNEVFMDILGGRLTTDVVNTLVTNDIPCEVWTIDYSADVYALNNYVTGITTNSANPKKWIYNACINA
ncbi:MAG: glycerophosphodiester phosphodiesterase family protein, partial [Oscillospiraceae bacterium]|nr:glycerophosphodiester phosphodiesterase family protein [Oscillospiraceae bacterium]